VVQVVLRSTVTATGGGGTLESALSLTAQDIQLLLVLVALVVFKVLN
jgi:hypothetical protein